MHEGAAPYEVVRRSPATDAYPASTPIYHTSNDLVPFIPTGTIYLEFNGGVSEASKREIIDKHGLDLIAIKEDGSVRANSRSPRRDSVLVAAELQREPAIRVAEPNLATEGELKQFSIPPDVRLKDQWHLQNGGNSEKKLKAGADARVVAAWRKMQSFGRPEITLGIIDDGFDLAHPDLSSRVRHAWDFARGSSDVRPVPSLVSPTSGNWHGTACAGIAVGGVGGGEIVGAAAGCSWIPVRWKPNLDPDEVAKWFDYVREKGASVVSCSWSALARKYPLPTPIANAISRCAREGRDGKGMIVVFAAGNEARDIDRPDEDSVNGYATDPNVIAVAASTSMDERADYSNFGAAVHVCAPSSGIGGRGITTADVTGEFSDTLGFPRPNGYVPGDYNEQFGKTSSACPLVAGVCGLILSVNPGLTAVEVREIIKSTARKIGAASDYDANGHSKHFGYGCIDAEAAVSKAMSALPIA